MAGKKNRFATIGDKLMELDEDGNEIPNEESFLGSFGKKSAADKIMNALSGVGNGIVKRVTEIGIEAPEDISRPGGKYVQSREEYDKVNLGRQKKKGPPAKDEFYDRDLAQAEQLDKDAETNSRAMEKWKLAPEGLKDELLNGPFEKKDLLEEMGDLSRETHAQVGELPSFLQEKEISRSPEDYEATAKIMRGLKKKSRR